MAAPTPVFTTLSETEETVTRMVSIPSGGDTDISATSMVDISAFTVGGASTRCGIRRIWSSLGGFAVNILFDATTDAQGFTVTGTGFIDLSHLVNGIPNNEASGVTGDINITTSGIADTENNVHNAGTLIVEYAKYSV